MNIRIAGVVVLLLAVQAALLFWYGQPALCRCGTVKLWEGNVNSSGNSQQLTDWYTFSHIIHGFLFYLLLWLLFPRMSVGKRLSLALGLEVGWELLENTPWLIDRYREQALAQGYVGDSIINSVSDSVAMIVGFLVAWSAPVSLTVAAAIALEGFTGLMIRDGLILNVLNFIHVFPAIARWQSGG